MNRYDSGYYNDRYYQPDDDFDDYDYEREKYIARSIKEYMTEGAQCYPFTQRNFGEALSEMGHEDKLLAEANDIDKNIAIEYWYDMAKYLSEQDWENY
jgi:hypothetical protein